MCIDPILYVLGIVVSILMGTILLFLGVSYVSLKYFPKSKFSSWSRRHVITDEDLERP